jgi:MFS family permease
MNERPLPDEWHNSDDLGEAIAPLLPEHKNTHRFGGGRPRTLGAMAGSGKKRLPYEITQSGLLAVSTAFIISLCLFWYGAESVAAIVKQVMGIEPCPIASSCPRFSAILAGASIMGGALGAVIGRLFQDDRGGAASMGAFVGALAGPLIALILLAELLLGIWMWLGCPSGPAHEKNT